MLVLPPGSGRVDRSMDGKVAPDLAGRRQSNARGAD
jgi:hypothetical protein